MPLKKLFVLIFLTISCSGVENARERVLGADELRTAIGWHDLLSCLDAIPKELHPWCVRTFRPDDHVDTVAWNFDGTLLAACSVQRQVLFNKHMRAEHSLPYGEDGLYSRPFVWKPGRNSCFCSMSPEIVTINFAAEPEREPEKVVHFEPPGRVYYMACNPLGTELAITHRRDDILVVPLEAPDEPTRLSGHSGAVHGLSWHPRGHLLASGSFDQTVRLWDKTRGWATVQILEHPDLVSSVAWNQEGTRLAAGCYGGSVYLWDELGQRQRVFQAPAPREVWALAWHPRRNNALASGSEDGAICIFDLDRPTAEPLIVQYPGPRGVKSLSWHPDGYVLAASGRDPAVRLWIDYRNLLLDYFQGRTRQKPTPQQLWLYGLLFRYKQEDKPIYMPEFLAELQKAIPGQTMKDLESVRNSLPIPIQQALARILDIRKRGQA